MKQPELPRLYVGLPDRQVVVCLTPKAASSSIIAALLLHYRVAPRGTLHLNPALPFMDRQAVLRHVPHWRRAMFVRNPFDRLVSCYVFHIVETRLAYAANLARLGFRAGMTFDDFIAMATRRPDADPHTAVQARQFDRVDFVGRVESMGADWARFRTFTGLPLPEPELRNVSNRNGKSYRDFYSDRTRRMVQQAYAEGLEAFGYAF